MVVDAEFQIEAWREARRILVLRILDKGLFGTQARHQLQRGRPQRHSQRLLHVGREVMHIGDVRIRTGAVPVRREGGGRIVLPVPDIAVGTPRSADLGIAVHVAPAAHPRGLEVGRIVELLGIDVFGRIIDRREHLGDVIPFLFGMDGRKGGRIEVIGALACKVVGIVERRVEVQARDPRPVQQPFERGVGTQHIVTHLLPLAFLGIGVVLGIHTADIGRYAEIETQNLGEGILVVERQPRAGIGGVGRRGVLRGPRILDVAVQHPVVPPQVEALRGGDLFGARIGGERHRIGRLALAGRDFHHTRRNVAVFGRRYSGHHLDRLDVGRRQVACAGTRRVAQRSIGGKAYAVDLDGRTERRIAGRAPAAAQRKDIVLHQVGINRFATRQQCRDVRRIDHLQVVDGIAADRTRRSHGVGRLLGRHHDALQFQVILGGIKPDRPHPRTHVDLGFGGNEPQAGNDKTRFPGRDSLHREVSVGIGHGPQSGLRQFDDCLSDRLAGILYKHPSRNVETLRRHDSRDNRA